MISGFKGVLKRVNKFNVSLNALLVYITILEVSWSLGDVVQNVYSEYGRKFWYLFLFIFLFFSSFDDNEEKLR